jgi:hypothetical protein
MVTAARVPADRHLTRDDAGLGVFRKPAAAKML